MTTKTSTAETVELRAGHLDDTQLARAEGLDRARKVLTAKGFASDGAADAMDLINVASWIIDGRDPWGDATTPEEPATTFVTEISRTAADVARDFADAIGIDPDAPLPDPSDDDDQLGTVRA